MLSMKRAKITSIISSLYSIKSTQLQHDQTFKLIQSELLELTLNQQPSSHDLEAFLQTQDQFDLNICSALLDWVGRRIPDLEKVQNGFGEEEEALRRRMTVALSCVQGLLLLHRPSQALFKRASSFEYLLAILATTRPSHLSSPHLPSTSPILLPSTPPLSQTGDKPRQNSSTALALQTLESILCALVDKSDNLRCFEGEKGLEGVVKVLKDKKVEGVVRIKAIEILYYYLLPETSSSSSHTLSHSFSPLSDFVPQTPQKPTHAYRHSISTPLATPLATPRRSRHKRNQSSLCGSSRRDGEFLFSTAGQSDGTGTSVFDVDRTPRATKENQPILRSSLMSSGRTLGGGLKDISNSSLIALYETEEGGEEKTPVPKARGRRKPVPEYFHDEVEVATPRVSQAQVLKRRDERETERRSDREKKELLRRIMPNVDALEERFKAMGLGVGAF